MVPEPSEQSDEELVLAFLTEGGEDFTSGEALSDKLGLSRAAVWKHVESLRQKGYLIEAAPARGYRLVRAPDRVSPLELSPLLSTRELGRVIHYQESLPSTNAVAQRLAAAGAGHGEVVIADAQTNGRGRRGRVWSSPPGLNLYLSVILRPELPAHRAGELTLVAAVALAECLREGGAAGVGIKWPNDLLVEERKLAGILTELSAEGGRVLWVVLGMGVNLNAGPDDLGPDLRGSATSLRQVRGGERVSRAAFTAALLSHLEEALDLHEANGFEPVRQAGRKLSLTLGREVLVNTERRELRGLAEDIDETGALLVRGPDGKRERVLTGDLQQLRPRPPAAPR